MFLDTNPQSATNTSRAMVEVMVWQAAYGGTQPVGYEDVTVDAPSIQLGGVT
jgi:hypothetical protein